MLARLFLAVRVKSASRLEKRKASLKNVAVGPEGELLMNDQLSLLKKLLRLNDQTREFLAVFVFTFVFLFNERCF